MKARLDIKPHIRGFSTLEIVIALALMITVIVGAVNANIASQYWSLTSQTSNEALYKAKTIIEQLRSVSEADFQQASTSELLASVDVNDPADVSCIEGGLCYFTRSVIVDISSCSKYAEAYVAWQIAARYATATEQLYTNLTSNNEIIARGGDCALNVPNGSWTSAVPAVGGTYSITASFVTGLDVLQKKIYLTSSSSPQLKVLSTPTNIGDNPSLLGSTVGSGRRLNGVDVVRDLSTGRTYAYVMQASSTLQFAVFDVTDASNPALVTERTLFDVNQAGSYPEGWRVFVYGGRAYVFARETDGRELHIFNINAPAQPSEITAAARDINRTVNDVVVREQVVGGALHRYAFLAASSDVKELSIFDVTDDNVTEVMIVNLPGSEDAETLYVMGNRLYLGRDSSTGAELYVFDIESLLSGDSNPIASSEVGADITTLRGVGELLFLGTSKSGQEFQVWKSDTDTWSDVMPNAGRISFINHSGLGPLGIDFSENFVYLVNQFSSGNELLKVIYTP